MAGKDIIINQFYGINNQISKKVINNTQFVDALNFDVTGDVKNGLLLKTRDRWKKIKDLVDGHSLFATKKSMFFIDNDDLFICDKNFNYEIIDSGYRGLDTSYCYFNNTLFISNEKFIRRYKNGKIYNLTPDKFNNDFLLTENVNGSLNPATYLIACTFVYDDGIEGPCNNPIKYILTSNGGIKIKNFPAITDYNIDKIRVYISRENSTILNLYGEYNIDINEVIINSSNATGQQLDKINLIPLQAGHIVENFNGVLLTAKDNIVYLSKPFSYFYDNYLEYEEKITMIGVVGDGFFVSDEESVWFTNSTTQPGRVHLEDGAIINSMTKNTRNSQIHFFSKHGQFKGSSGGKIEAISSNFKPDLELIKGASLFLNRNGEERIISSFKSSGEKSGLVIRDWVKIEKV